MKNNWQTKKLVELCAIFSDGDWIESKDQSSEGVRLIQTGNVGIGAFKDRGEKARYISESTFKRLRCSEIFEGDCLISRLPDPAGRSCIVPDTGSKMITAVDCTIVRFDSKEIIPHYFNYYSQSVEYLNNVDQETTGTTRKRISRNNLGNVSIPLPPLSEQKRIVAALDKAFAAIATAKENAEKNLANARELFESYLQNVFANPGDGWEEKQLGDITSKIGSGATPRGGKESYKEEGISLIRSLNVHDWGFKYKKLAKIDDNQAQLLANVALEVGDILLNITGASIARSCIVPIEILPARVNQHVSIIRLIKNAMIPQFLHYILISKPYKDKILKTGAQGSTRQANTKSQIEQFVIAYPKNIKEQKRIVAKIDELLVETKKLEEIYRHKIADLEELKKSMLRKAFNGDL